MPMPSFFACLVLPLYSQELKKYIRETLPGSDIQLVAFSSCHFAMPSICVLVYWSSRRLVVLYVLLRTTRCLLSTISFLLWTRFCDCLLYVRTMMFQPLIGFLFEMCARQQGLLKDPQALAKGNTHKMIARATTRFNWHSRNDTTRDWSLRSESSSPRSGLVCQAGFPN